MDWLQKMSISRAWHVNHAHINCLLLRRKIHFLSGGFGYCLRQQFFVSARYTGKSWNGIAGWCVPRIDLLEIIVFRGLWVIKHAQNNSIGHVNKSLLVRRPWLFHSRRWWRLRWWRWCRGCRRQVAKIIHLIAGNVNLQWPPLRSRLRKLQMHINSFFKDTKFVAVSVVVCHNER